jgi:hypothetical protein
MKCRNAKKLIIESIDGLKDDTKRLELEQHLVECSECDKFAAQMTRSMDLLHRAPPEATSDNFAWKVRLKINQERNEIHERVASYGTIVRSWNLRYATAALAAAAVVLAGGLLMVKDGLAPLPSPKGGSPDVQVAYEPTTSTPQDVTTGSGSKTVSGAAEEPTSRAPQLPPSGRSNTGLRTVDYGVGPRLLGPQGPGKIIGVDLIDQYEPMSVAQMDSLMHVQLDGLRADERLRYLTQYMTVLQTHLLRTQLQRHTGR